MKSRLKNCLETAKETYCDFMSKHVDDFWTNSGYELRRKHIDIFSEILTNEFDFDDVRLIETGVSGNLHYGFWGFFLGAFTQSYGGEMHSVDLNSQSCQNSEKIFSEKLPKLKYKTYCQDSVQFLKFPPIIPNLVHLDSFDFQLFDPLPSALHCWKEFEKIGKFLPKGAIILIDDNWMKNTFLEWFQGGRRFEKIIDIPIIGKGANVYQEVLAGRTDFELIGDYHVPYKMIKIYIKKNK